MVMDQHKKNPHAVALGRKGGSAGRGEAKRRGDSEHYRRVVQARGEYVKWISVEERLPGPDEWVLFWDAEVCTTVLCLGRRDNSGTWYDEGSVDVDGSPMPRYCVTHWMALPRPPRKPEFNPKQEE